MNWVSNQRNRRVVLRCRTVVLALTAVLAASTPAPTFAGPMLTQAAFFDDAFARAALPPVGGASYVITANLNMNGGPGTEFLSARGRVALQPGGTLGGDLPLSINNKEVPNNVIRVAIRKSSPAVVVVQRLIGGKPFLGRPPKIVSLPVDPAFNYLAGSVSWHDGDRMLQIFLETQLQKPDTKPTPIGIRYTVSGSVRVTNSDDGVADSTVELWGEVRLGLNNSSGQFVRGSEYLANGPQGSRRAGEYFRLRTVTVDVFNDENIDNFDILNFFNDSDDLSSPDYLWNGCSGKFRFTPEKTQKVFCEGDKLDESLDVTIQVTPKELLYKK